MASISIDGYITVMKPNVKIYNNIALLKPGNSFDLYSNLNYTSYDFKFRKLLKGENITSVAIDENNVLVGTMSGSA